MWESTGGERSRLITSRARPESIFSSSTSQRDRPQESHSGSSIGNRRSDSLLKSTPTQGAQQSDRTSVVFDHSLPRFH